MSGQSLRSKGDAARDARDWAGAEKAYRDFLSSKPDDAAIWVQYGHILKEQDKSSDAERAYRKAVALRPDDGDPSLHLAHLLKRMGRLSEATEMFETSFKASPTGDAYGELLALRGERVDLDEDDSDETLTTSATFIEIDDLLGYLEAHKTLSGIQRVQVGVIQHVLASARQNENCVFVLNPINGDSLWMLKNEHLRELVDYVTGPNVDHEQLRRIVARARSGATLISPQAGQCYLVLGAFWGSGGVAGRYLHLKKVGVLLGVYIYDLIPITHSEYCDARLSHEFAMSFGDGMAIFDFVLTISDYTAREVIRYREKFNLPAMPVITVPLAHSHSDNVTPRKRMVWGPHIAQLKDRPYVLMVSTIEARKNHAYLVAAWKQFLEEGLDPPDLVFVGRFGWHVSSLMEMLELTRNLDGRVHVLHDLSDAELQTLYDGSLFTAFTSFVEGWGLPVGESLAQGRPCVASSTSSVPEVGGDLVDYVDPHNLRDGLEVLRKMAFNDAYRAQRERDIADRFVARTWRDVGVDLLEKVGKVRTTVKTNPSGEMFFAAGSVFTVSDLAFGTILPKDYGLSPKRLMLTDFGYTIEPHGCWMRGNKGSLRFRSDQPAGTEISVYLQFLSAPWANHDNLLSIDMDKPGIRPSSKRVDNKRSLAPNSRFLMRCSGTVGEKGSVSVNVVVSGHVPLEHGGPGARRFCVGLSEFGYTASADLVARVDMSEHFMFNAMGR
ncbi:glycosyltransferase family 4 protein [Acidisoma cladoniae]|uniref:glycosyltransferase family 4 protein n=1 Tax=Acidisoma cladoniae TaxID=3040935 RepID=UPI00254BB000|nr:glycosyltransferase [Acidisoma sp. PAMC 29798]